jgi:hypothetical protein
MPRLKNETSVLLADLKSRIDEMVETAIREGHDQALSEVRALVGGGLPARRGPGRPRKSVAGAAAPSAPRKKRKNPWASMTKEQREERVRKMLAGRGLKPKGE